MKPTIRTIAEALGLSPATISKALSGHKEVNADTRGKVTDYASEIGYIRKAEGRRRLGILAGSSSDREDSHTSLLYGMMMGFRRYASRMRYEVVIFSIDSIEQSREPLDQVAHNNQLSGMLVSGLKTTDPYYEQLRTVGTPVVVWDVNSDNPRVGSVGYNSVSGGELAVGHLVKLGHRRIAFVNGHQEAYISRERAAGYLAALNHYEIPFNPVLCLTGDFTAESGARAADLLAGTDATAVYCAGDMMALGAIRRFHELGIRLPAEMSVVGFDNLPICLGCMPSITTVDQNPSELGETACAILHGLIQDVPIRHVRLEPKLIVRASTAAPRA